jgi:acetamidase/formamidase
MAANTVEPKITAPLTAYEGPTSSPEALEVLKTMAGPVYIEGAKPGDTLKIEVLDVTLPLD